MKDQWVADIEEFNQRIVRSVDAFQVCDDVRHPPPDHLYTSLQITSLMDIQAWQRKNDEARARDHKRLHAKLDKLAAEKNAIHLMRVLGQPLDF